MSDIIPLVTLGELFDDTFFYLTFIVLLAAVIGMFSMSFSYSLYAAFVTFVSLTLETGYEIYEYFLIIVVMVSLFFLTFQLFNITQGGSAGSEVGG